MNLREDLLAFVRRRLDEVGAPLDGALREDTSLIASGLLDSLSLLSLIEWIERRTGGQVDLQAVDLVRDWDTIDGIARFLEGA